MRGADLLVQTLAAAGVRRIFSLSGNQIMAIYDACLSEGIEIVHTRHEAAAAFMADAYAQLGGGIGVCLVTAAPGASNALGPLFSARQSESPVLFLTGDSALAQDGKGAFQELDQVAMTAPLTKLSFRARSSAALGEDIARAIRAALSGRPGPVHVALPVDVVEGDAHGGTLPDKTALRRSAAPLARADAEVLRGLLAGAARPVVICGPSMNTTRTGDRLARLEAALDAPAIVMESPRGLKDPALGDFAQGLSQADLILSLGKPVNFTLGFGLADLFAPGARWALIDADAEEHARARTNLGARLVASVTADSRDAAMDLIAMGGGGAARMGWREDIAGLIARRAGAAEGDKSDGPITPAAICAAVARCINTSRPAVVISDGGEFGQWAQAGTRADFRMINGPSGAIGGGLCYALAAKKAKPDATVFALMGDGTVGFHLPEFETAARENTPFVAVIGNDRRWNAEHQIQMRDYGAGRLIGCDLSGARYDLAARALGAHGEYVTRLADLDAALLGALQSGKPACVNIEMEGRPAPSGSAH